MKLIEEDAIRNLRQPRIHAFHPEDLKKLRKAGLFTRRRGEKVCLLLEK